MFGSFIPEREDDKPDYGIVKPLNSYNPIVVAYHEFAALLRDCASDGLRPWVWFRRAANAPGWSPDGNHNRTEEIRARWLAERESESGSV